MKLSYFRSSEENIKHTRNKTKDEIIAEGLKDAMQNFQNRCVFQKRAIMKHKKKNEIKLGKNEEFAEGISCTFCVDCGYNDYDYD